MNFLPGVGASHVKDGEMLVGKFELEPQRKTSLGVVCACVKLFLTLTDTPREDK